MVFIRLGGEKVEGFYFHNNWKVQVDYGMNMTEIPFSDYNEIDESSLPSKDVLYCRGGKSSDYFRILKLFKDGKLISEIIEKNPNYVPRDTQLKMLEDHVIIGEDVERVFNFPNGYSAKIEYWISPTERDYKHGFYTAKYRKLILSDDKDNIISDIFEDNPNYRSFDKICWDYSDTSGRF
ncbi:hypothetical protein [Methanobrevibacter smithii]|jgi:hypothetical protein|uniref:hypothetical protein n=1 Tax=Methanobrevibacter smithii TaxID=2173 RepID=UPI00266CC3E0|nr:hypothetical protein [Methanobrevibacter smithii]MEE0720811.1 hypothetical protein [Methanobrevibacter smithii]